MSWPISEVGEHRCKIWESPLPGGTQGFDDPNVVKEVSWLEPREGLSSWDRTPLPQAGSFQVGSSLLRQSTPHPDVVLGEPAVPSELTWQVGGEFESPEGKTSGHLNG